MFAVHSVIPAIVLCHCCCKMKDFQVVTVPTQKELQQLTSLKQLCTFGLLNVSSKASEEDAFTDLFETVLCK